MRLRGLGAVALPALVVLLSAPPARGGPAPQQKVPVLLDSDIGDDLDDALALALILQSPEIDLRGVTTVSGDAHTRALIVCRLLHAVGRTDVPVAAGSPARLVPDFSSQMQYGLRPCFRKRPERAAAVEFLYQQLKARAGELTILAIGPLTNVAELLRKHPDCKSWIKRIVLMGGAVRVGYKMKPPPEPEWNIKSDATAAQVVFASGVPLVVAPLDATANLALDSGRRRRIWALGTPLTNQLHALYQLWDRKTPILFDPVAVALCFTEKFCTMEELRLEVDNKGLTRIVKGKPNARVATATRRDEFIKWYTARVAPGKPTPLPKLPRTNLAKPVERGMMPNRVHVIEDYETDIERRWWLCGRLETKDVPPGSKRACRGVLTNDFDDRMGDAKAMYQAVIFNPVPGPPMGKHPRLCFRCKLQGTDALRVQIYSLSKGYHRHVTLTGLPQGKWQSLAVDMTTARRPDGSGGPLSEGERIDDIQFYTDPDAELLMDDIVLYDAAVPGEKRPFPARLHFTGWFDTGKQGKEWPGEFEIVPKGKAQTWRAAKSVPNKKTGQKWLRIGLRGDRIVEERLHLRFRYHLTGTNQMELSLRGSKPSEPVLLLGLVQGKWAEETLDMGFETPMASRVSEITFSIPAGSELLVDDVLLYEKIPRKRLPAPQQALIELEDPSFHDFVGMPRAGDDLWSRHGMLHRGSPHALMFLCGTKAKVDDDLLRLAKSHTELGIRYRAAYVLAKRGNAKVVPLLDRMCESKDPFERYLGWAAYDRGLRERKLIPPEDLMRHLDLYLKEKHWEVREQIEWFFGYSKARPAVKHLLGQLNRESSARAAVWALGQIGDASAVPDIIKAYPKDMGSRTDLFALARLATPQAVDFLIQHLDDYGAPEALASTKSPRALPALQKHFDRLRGQKKADSLALTETRMAVLCLSRKDPREALMAILEDPKEKSDYRFAALRAIYEYDTRHLERRLLKLYRTRKDPDTRLICFRLLENSTLDGVTEAMIQHVLTLEIPSMRDYAARYELLTAINVRLETLFQNTDELQAHLAKKKAKKQERR
jgi:inosine-uridine nucleoside N-ribohydrolase/HEAT repeat protein